MKKIKINFFSFTILCSLVIFCSTSSAVAISILQWKNQWAGRYRKMAASLFKAAPTKSTLKDFREIIVITPGIIENCNWYSNPLAALPIIDFFTLRGFDVLTLSFLPTNSQALTETKSTDYSFNEIVTVHLPSIAQMLKEKGWNKVHWLGHSYGATLNAAFLLGYQPRVFENGRQGFVINQELSKQRQARAASLITISGLFKLYWPINFWELWNPMNLSSNNLFQSSPLIQYLLEKLPLKLLSVLKPTVGFNWLKLYGDFGFPFVVPNWIPLQGYSNLLNPIFYAPNVAEDSIKYALENGLSTESFETISTVSSLYYLPQRLDWPSSSALSNFTSDLEKLTVPTLFIAGDKDLLTHAEGIRKYGFEVIGSPIKTFTVLPETGHQDILISKHPEKLMGALLNWFEKLANSRRSPKP